MNIIYFVTDELDLTSRTAYKALHKTRILLGGLIQGVEASTEYEVRVKSAEYSIYEVSRRLESRERNLGLPIIKN